MRGWRGLHRSHADGSCHVHGVIVGIRIIMDSTPGRSQTRGSQRTHQHPGEQPPSQLFCLQCPGRCTPGHQCLGTRASPSWLPAKEAKQHVQGSARVIVPDVQVRSILPRSDLTDYGLGVVKSPFRFICCCLVATCPANAASTVCKCTRAAA